VIEFGMGKKFFLKLRNKKQWRKDFCFIIFERKYALKTHLEAQIA
jgi:hypothetical protein